MRVVEETGSPSPEPRSLSHEHRRMLEEGSAIAREVLEESGARTIRRGRELPDVFSERQRRRAPGMLFEVQRPNGQVTWSFRPDHIDPDRPGHKYEAPCKARGGPGNVLGVLPSQRRLIADAGVPVVFVEGQKKQLAFISAARKAGVDVLVVAIVGVWNWLHDGGKPIPDMAGIPLGDRNATVMFDSDMLRKPEVQDAAKRLAEYLEGRGAEAYVTYFRDNPDGSKVGADDFFASEGGTFAELRMLTRRYDPDDFRLVRLSRSERLRGMLEGLERTYAAMPAAKGGECSDRATMREALRRAEESGQVTEGGIVVRLPVRPLLVKTRLGRQGQANSLKRLQANGYLERIEEPPHKVEKHGAAYLLKASTESLGRALSGQGRERRRQHSVSQEQGEEREPLCYADLYAGVHSARAPESVPELRHSKVVHTWERRNGRRAVVDSEYVYRLGKPRQEVLMYLLAAGGEVPEPELLERFGSKSTRPRDFHRRKIAPLMGWRYARDKATGAERRLETGPEIVTCEEGMVRILPGWREALEEHREQTGELDDNRHQEQRAREQSKAYRNRDKTPADTQPSPLRGKAETRRILAESAKRDKERWVEEQRQKVGETAATFLADELEGISAVRYQEARQRWARRGGRVEDLRLAVLYGPWRFKYEDDGDLYVHHEDGAHRPGGPNDHLWRERMAASSAGEEPERAASRRIPPKVGDVYQHGPVCACEWCVDTPGPSYALAWSAS
jgi:hypothetical protein